MLAEHIAEMAVEYVVASLILAPVRYGIPVRGHMLRVQTEINMALHTIDLFERAS